MPPKAPLEENTLFLFTCLINSDYKSSGVDHSAIAAALNITANASRKRFTRLKARIEEGALGDGDDARRQGATASPSTSATAGKATKRKTVEADGSPVKKAVKKMKVRAEEKEDDGAVEREA
ncbi:hypothetical protein MMC21_005355 [Puttea exsequens]|nr:hypothetical protein [Puttea exsequens]